MVDYYREFIEKYPMYGGDRLIQKAFEVAIKAHDGQFRDSGEPYIIHPVAVTRILADLGMDKVSICAGMLHDVPEDVEEYPIEYIRAQFNEEIANIVDGVTKLKKFGFQTKEEAQAESMRKMFVAMASDVRVVIIKLADRLHNMRTLGYKTGDKQKAKAKETLEIYAPLAHRFGIYAFKWEFEDLALKYLEPEAFYEIAKKLSATRSEREAYIREVIGKIEKNIQPLGIKYEIEGRPKHIYSIYRKLKDKRKTFDELYDIMAVRVIVESVKDCYAVLGTVHAVWRPMPGRFKDYIAVPKPNMYQSLHTTLMGEDGKPFEVQIRTFEMHRTAEYGIAAHWKYKDGTTANQSDFDKKISWLREMMEWQNEMKDSKEFMEALRINFFSDTVFVFTPKGDVRDLAVGSTPLDFAYSIHSAIGNKCIGAKVNGRIVPLNYQLQTGDIVEVITSAASKGPSRDWLNIVRTATARSKIRAWFKKELKEENIVKGKAMLEREAKRKGFELSGLLEPEWLKDIYRRFTLNSEEDMYAAVGYGGLSTGQILSRLIEKYKIAHKVEESPEIHAHGPEKKQLGGDSNISVKGYSDMVVRLAKCCNPLPGDDIIGFITRGRGVSVHRADCSNLNEEDFPASRRIEVAWRQQKPAHYSVELQIEGEDRGGLMADVSQVFYSLGYSMSSFSGRSTKNNQCIINAVISIQSPEELEEVLRKLHNVKSVIRAYRVNN